MLPRFHAPALDAARREATLGDDEGRHLTKVMRLGVGDEVAVFDGRGREYRARVRTVERHAVKVELLEALPAAVEPRVSLTLVQGILKGDGMDAVVRDATMLGVTAIVPVMTSHVSVKAAVLERGRPTERWRRVALASAKQCRRATLPDIAEPRPFREWLASRDPGERLLCVEPSYVSQAAGMPAPATLHEWLRRPEPARASLVVGPEGGWASDEVEAAIAAGCVPVSLGGLTLRADAVAVVGLAVARFVFDRQHA